MAHNRTDGFAPIEDYALIGDGRTCALVAADGSIDWWPVAALDAPPAFAALLDPAGGGCVRVAPTDEFTSRRRYLPGSNVLETTFTTGHGVVRVTDALPLGLSGRLAWAELARRVEGVEGSVEMEWSIAPGTKFGKVRPWIAPRDAGWMIHVGEDMLAIRAHQIGDPQVDEDRVTGHFTTAPGSRGLLSLMGGPNTPVFCATPEEVDSHIDLTVARWRDWSDAVAYDGPWAHAVGRSALALKLLLHAPTGAIAAAPTTSLPEQLGGPKNWDYRYMWVRDASFSIDALMALTLTDETQAAVQWLLGAARRSAPELRVLYRLDGSDPEPVTELPLPGYRDSRPVRQGNTAATQRQLGNFGDLFDTVWRYVQDGHCLDTSSERLLEDLADRCCDTWQQPDSGIWELATERHYTISKIGCWTALDRAVRLHEAGELSGAAVQRWARERDLVKAWVEEHCWSSALGSYTFYAGADALDAATLLAARTGFDTGERLAGTVAAVRDELGAGPFLYRYSGMRDEEGAFVACSFWLVNALVTLGELDEARALMDDLVKSANDVGLLAEQIDPATGAHLGNFPQGLSHLSLINAAVAYRRAESAG